MTFWTDPVLQSTICQGEDDCVIRRRKITRARCRVPTARSTRAGGWRVSIAWPWPGGGHVRLPLARRRQGLQATDRQTPWLCSANVHSCLSLVHPVRSKWSVPVDLVYYMFSFCADLSICWMISRPGRSRGEAYAITAPTTSLTVLLFVGWCYSE
jgi:hypothetical protein